jgi:hypothetical protein
MTFFNQPLLISLMVKFLVHVNRGFYPCGKGNGNACLSPLSKGADCLAGGPVQ